MYRYETHCHTRPVSRCSRVGVRETLTYYRDLGYDGVFLSNHFISKTNPNADMSYEEKLDYFFGDYEEGLALQEELGIRVFFALEIAHRGSDFLVYGLGKDWFLTQPDFLDLTIKQQLARMKEAGGLVIHAHPFREAAHIDYIRLMPRLVHGVEVNNASRIDFENHIAELYAKEYRLGRFAGSDNHDAAGQRHLAGMCSATPIRDEQDFVRAYHAGELELFVLDVPAEGLA